MKVNKKSLPTLFFNRLFISCVLILLQLSFFISLLVTVAEFAISVFIGLQLLSVIAVIWIVSKNDNPSYKLAWVIAILGVPIFGGLFYILWGNIHQTKEVHAVSSFCENYIKTNTHQDPLVMESLKKENPQLAVRAEYINHTAGFSLYQNTSAEYLSLGEIKFEKLKEELSCAKHFIFMEYFIIQQGKMWDPILEILIAKVTEGVEVRVMYDDMGCIQTLPPHYNKKLESYGIKVTTFNPFRPRLNMVMNYRDHRKICVIDGNVGFCSGINLADEYINAYPKHGHWKDTGVVLYGEAVWDLTVMFLTLWNVTNNEVTLDSSPYRPTKTYPSDGYVQPFSDSPLDEFNIAEYNYMQIINRACDYVYITTPYLILDNEMITSLTIAAQSGIDVRILTPHIADKWYVHILTQAYYIPLIKAGVKIYEYTPGFVHAKMFVSDDNTAVVGTANMDYRSFYLHYECGVSFYNSSVCYKVRDDILATLDISQQITMDDLNKISVWKRCLRSVIRIFAPLM